MVAELARLNSDWRPSMESEPVLLLKRSPLGLFKVDGGLVSMRLAVPLALTLGRRSA